MQYTKTVLIKFAICFVITWVVLGVFYAVPLRHIFLLSLFVAVVSFFLADLYVLPRLENWGATLTDFLSTFAIVWLYSVNVIQTVFPIVTAAGITAVLIAIAGIFYRRYVNRYIYFDQLDEQVNPQSGDLRTEFGKEFEEGD